MTTNEKLKRLTPHQGNVFRALGRKSKRQEEIGSHRGAWVEADQIGSAGALEHLFEKGYANRKNEPGPMGGKHLHYRPIWTESAIKAYDRLERKHAEQQAEARREFDKRNRADGTITPGPWNGRS